MADVLEERAVSALSLGLCALLALLACVLGHWAGRKLSSSNDRWIIVWLFYDFLTHLILEGSFVYFSLTGSVSGSDNTLALLWKEYGKADKRWLHSDPTVVSIEILTVGLCLPIMVLIYAICKDKYYRHIIQITVSVCELYGGWMTFAPEWLTGSQNLDTQDHLHHFLYLWFFNGLWVVIPALLLMDSLAAMKEMHQKSASRSKFD